MLIKLAPTPAPPAALLRPLEACNAACTAVAEVACAHQLATTIAWPQRVSSDVRHQVGVSAQMAMRAIAQVAQADTRAQRSKPAWRAHGALVDDERLSHLPTAERVWLVTLDGRVVIPLRLGVSAAAMLPRRRGHGDVLSRTRRATWFLAVTVDAPAPTPAAARDYLGVDVGSLTLAATRDGAFLNRSPGPTHAPINAGRARCTRWRQTVQTRGTQAGQRLRKPRGGRAPRCQQEVTPGRSNALVQTAKGTGRGLARADLHGMRSRVTGATRQRSVLHRWACCHVRAVIADTAALAGVPGASVSPAYPSQTCRRWGSCEQANRRAQAHVLGGSCGCSAPADRNAAEHIRRAALSCSQPSRPVDRLDPQAIA